MRAIVAGERDGHVLGAMKNVRVRASVEEIAKEDWTLNISRYVTPKSTHEIPPLPEAIAAFKAALTRCREAEAALEKAMVEGGWLE